MSRTEKGLASKCVENTHDFGEIGTYFCGGLAACAFIGLVLLAVAKELLANCVEEDCDSTPILDITEAVTTLLFGFAFLSTGVSGFMYVFGRICVDDSAYSSSRSLERGRGITLSGVNDLPPEAFQRITSPPRVYRY